MILVIVKTCDDNYGKTIAVNEKGDIVLECVYDMFEYSNEDIVDDVYQELCCKDVDAYLNENFKLIEF